VEAKASDIAAAKRLAKEFRQILCARPAQLEREIIAMDKAVAAVRFKGDQRSLAAFWSRLEKSITVVETLVDKEAAARKRVARALKATGAKRKG
jgi:hypothetical protein